MLRRILLCVCAALFLAGCGGSSGSFEAAGGDAPGSDDQVALASFIQGRVEIGGQPVPATAVQLRARGQVVGSATSDEGGQFRIDLDGGEPLDPVDQVPEVSAQASSPLPVDVVATIDGTRYAAVVPEGAEFVYITEISTLIHDYMEAHPQATLEAANAAVGAALGCPPEDSASTLSDPDIFDPVTFQEVAAENGGAASFLSGVVSGIDGGDFDFGYRDPYEALDYEGMDPTAVCSNPLDSMVPERSPRAPFWAERGRVWLSACWARSAREGLAGWSAHYRPTPILRSMTCWIG